MCIRDSSEIGSPCAKCVARKLSGRYPKRDEGGGGWRAQVGTMGHDYLEHHFIQRFPWMFEQVEFDRPDGTIGWKWQTIPELNPTPDAPVLYYLERKLQVWEYGGVVIERDTFNLDLNGSCDLFSRIWTPYGEIGVVTDWKFQGPNKLTETGKGKIGETYHVQMNTYGLGYELAGFTPTHVDLHALPRDGHLDESRPVLMRYDRQVAIDALQRIKAMIDAAAILGWEAFIATQAKAPGCFDCDFYESVEESGFIEQLTA